MLSSSCPPRACRLLCRARGRATVTLRVRGRLEGAVLSQRGTLPHTETFRRAQGATLEEGDEREVWHATVTAGRELAFGLKVRLGEGCHSSLSVQAALRPEKPYLVSRSLTPTVAPWKVTPAGGHAVDVYVPASFCTFRGLNAVKGWRDFGTIMIENKATEMALGVEWEPNSAAKARSRAFAANAEAPAFADDRMDEDQRAGSVSAVGALIGVALTLYGAQIAGIWPAAGHGELPSLELSLPRALKADPFDAAIAEVELACADNTASEAVVAQVERAVEAMDAAATRALAASKGVDTAAESATTAWLQDASAPGDSAEAAVAELVEVRVLDEAIVALRDAMATATREQGEAVAQIAAVRVDTGAAIEAAIGGRNLEVADALAVRASPALRAFETSLDEAVRRGDAATEESQIAAARALAEAERVSADAKALGQDTMRAPNSQHVGLKWGALNVILLAGTTAVFGRGRLDTDTSSGSPTEAERLEQPNTTTATAEALVDKEGRMDGATFSPSIVSPLPAVVSPGPPSPARVATPPCPEPSETEQAEFVLASVDLHNPLE